VEEWKNVNRQGTKITKHITLSSLLYADDQMFLIERGDVLQGTVHSLLEIGSEYDTKISVGKMKSVPITVAALYEARTVFARSNVGIVGSNHTQGMDVCMCVYSVFVLSCV
jgi:hypothetical protein